MSIEFGNWVFYKRPASEVDYECGYSCSKCGFDLPANWYDFTRGYPNIKYCPNCGYCMCGESKIEVSPMNIYRARERNTYKWVEGHYVKYQPHTNDVCLSADMDMRAGIGNWVEGIVPTYASDLYLVHIIPETLCEYTGITIDDQRIYTGDLLQDENDIYEVVRDGHMFKCKGFYDPLYNVPYDAFSGEVSHLKLVGNKFDNPGLICNR